MAHLYAVFDLFLNCSFAETINNILETPELNKFGPLKPAIIFILGVELLQLLGNAMFDVQIQSLFFLFLLPKFVRKSPTLHLIPLFLQPMLKLLVHIDEDRIFYLGIIFSIDVDLIENSLVGISPIFFSFISLLFVFARFKKLDNVDDPLIVWLLSFLAGKFPCPAPQILHHEDIVQVTVLDIVW